MSRSTEPGGAGAGLPRTSDRGSLPSVAVFAVLAVAGAGALPTTGCATAGGPARAGTAALADSVLRPGFGTLRQEEITVSLRQDDLQIKVTPLAEWVLRLTAPDTYERLSGLAAAHRRPGHSLFLVSLFSDEPGTPYEPEDLTLGSRGRRFAPVAIRPLSSDWGSHRLDQQESRSAVYAFEEGVDLEIGVTVEYGAVRSAGWNTILPKLQAEYVRARARAGGPPR